MSWVWFVVAIVIFDLLLTALLIRTLVRRNWGPLTSRYPEQPAAPDAARRNFQSFKLGLLSLGYSVHVAADEQYLHLMPAKAIAMIGCRPVSIPWEDVSITKRSKSGKWTTVRLGPAVVMEGPSWCLDLADPDPPTPDSQYNSH